MYNFPKIIIIINTIFIKQHYIQSDCIQDLEKNQQYQLCNLEFMSYLANAGSYGSTGEGNQMVQIMCTNEGRAAMNCMEPFYKKCTILSSKPQLSIFEQVKVMGGLDKLCNQVSGPCTDAQKCINDIDIDIHINNRNNDFYSIYNIILEYYGRIICETLQKKYDCLSDLYDECIELKEQIETIVNLLRNDKVISTWPDNRYIINFAINECKNYPVGIIYNGTCNISKILSTANYYKCYDRYLPKYNIDKNECDKYNKSFKCVENAITEANCSNGYIDGSLYVVKLFIPFLGSECGVNDIDYIHISNVSKNCCLKFMKKTNIYLLIFILKIIIINVM